MTVTEIQPLSLEELRLIVYRLENKILEEKKRNEALTKAVDSLRQDIIDMEKRETSRYGSIVAQLNDCATCD